MIKENDDFVFVEHDSADFYSIKLKSGKFNGVIYTYGKVSIKEEKNRAKLSFTFKIEDLTESEFSKVELENSLEFKNHLGDILTEILSNSQFIIGNNNGVKPTDDNSEESNS